MNYGYTQLSLDITTIIVGSIVLTTAYTPLMAALYATAIVLSMNALFLIHDILKY